MEEEGKEERDKGHCLLLSFCVSFLLFGMERGRVAQRTGLADHSENASFVMSSHVFL